MPLPQIDLGAPPWLDVRARLRDMEAAFDSQETTALALAKRFSALAQSFLVAMEWGGTPSSRFRAVVKALDLKTPASALKRFLNDE